VDDTAPAWDLVRDAVLTLAVPPSR
jgi:hypothetical protein